MLTLSQPITAINGFKIGDKVRLKDGDGRPHIIKAFVIDGLKEFFFIVQFEDGTNAMLNNISFISPDFNEIAEDINFDNFVHVLEERYQEVSFAKIALIAKTVYDYANNTHQCV